MQPALIIISSVLALISPIVYTVAILNGEAKPHRTTRFVLLCVTLLASLALFANGDRVAIFLAGTSLVQSVIIFILSLRFGMGGWSTIDILCLLFSGIGIIFWQTTGEPVLALYASILSDFIGMIPAIIKTYRFPDTEIWTFYGIDMVATALNALAVTVPTIESLSYPAYLFGINFVMVILIVRLRIMKRLKKIFIDLIKRENGV